MSRKSTTEVLLEQKHGNLHEVIPEMVSKHGQLGTAEKLNVPQGWISRWLAKNGYEKRTVWVQSADRYHLTVKAVEYLGSAVDETA